MKKVLCFGEVLLRISPFIQESNQDPFSIFVGGAEANVARALAGFAVDVQYCSALPNNFMALHIMQFLNNQGVGTEKMILRGDRIGLYYLDQGADLKGAVIYDRSDSSFAKLQPGTIDWDSVFEGIEWFNFSAITPAISQNLADICLEAVKAANRKNIKVSVDLNYRSRLWKYTGSPIHVMKTLLPYCNLVMGNIWSANILLGIPIDDQIHAKGTKEAYLDQSIQVSKEIISQYPSCEMVANTFRFDKEENQILYYTSLYQGDHHFQTPDFNIGLINDRSGSGDCFMAGLIYGILQNDQPQNILNFATAAAVGKLQERGDGTRQNIEAVNRVLLNYLK
jgi:2-dehydro-3-deoxygluconokinase